MATRLFVKLTPNSKKNAVIGKTDDCWNIKIASQPIEGRANEALIKYLSDILDIAKSRISLEKGHTSRIKTLLIDGLDEATITAKLTNSNK